MQRYQNAEIRICLWRFFMTAYRGHWLTLHLQEKTTAAAGHGPRELQHYANDWSTVPIQGTL